MTTTPNTNSANKHKNKTSPLIPRQRHLMTPPINSITDTGVSFRIHNYDNNNPSNSNKKKKRNNRSSQRQPLGGGNPSVFLGSTTPTPTQQIQRQRQRQKQRRDKRSKHNANNVGNNSRALTLTSNHGDHTDNTDDNDEDDDLKYNFPSQVIPRGIAARTNGMQVFLQALFRGIVVRRHVPHGVAEFVMLSSKDGGDTISYEYIPEEEARVALLEQRVRFNRNHKKYKSQWLMNSFHDDRWSIMQMNGNTAATNNNNNNHHGGAGAGAGDITPKSGISQQPSVCCQQNPPHQNPQQPQQQQQQQQQQQPQQNQIYSHGHGYGGCKDHKSDWSSSYNNNNNNNHHPTLPPREAAAPSATSSSTNIPNHIIAHYQNQMQDGIFHKLSDYSTKFIHSGKIHAKDVVAVHPARHEDPFRSQERLMKQEMKLLQKQQKQLARQSQQEDENMNKNEEEEADLENPMVFVDNEHGNNNDSDNDDSDDDEGDSEDDAEYYGTWTLRKSKTQYCRDCAFSLILPQTRLKDAFYTAADTIKGKKSYFTDPQENINISSNSEKWYAGIGSMSSFRTLDLEAATEGEYWTIFRGFLLLHRDAASGRFAAERASGFSSHYNKLKREMEEKERNDNENKKNKYKCDEEEDYRIRWWHSLYPHVWRQEIQHKLENRAPVVAPPSDYFLGFKSSGTQIWSRLRQAGLETHRIYALDTNRVMIKVRCPPERLQDVAEVLKIKLRTVDGSFLPFQESIASQFLSSDEYSQRYAHHPSGTPNLFRSSDRQNIIDFIIRSRIRDSGAELGETSQLGKQIQMRVPLHMHAKLESLYVSWVTFWHKQNWIGRDGKSMTVGPDKYNQENANNNNNIVDPCIDMGDSHLSNNNTNISNNKVLSTRTLVSENAPPRGYFSRLIIGSFYQPLDSIQEYFGEGVAYYFAWLQHCSYHLVSLSVFGIIVTVCQIMSGTWDHPIRPYFSVVVMLWGLFVMITWRRRSNYLAHKWGTLNFEEEETTRPQFKGEYRRCDITQEWVIFYPAWKRWLKFCFSVPLTLAFTLLSTIGILIVHANRDIMLARHFELKHQIMEDGLSSSLIQSNATFALDLSIHAIGRKAPLTAVDFNLELIQDVEFWTIVVGFPTILGVCYPLFNYILMKISVMLNDFENHRTESQYRNQLVLKVFSLRFVCYFSSLYYYSFVLPEDTEQATENAIFRVATSLIVYLTVAHWWNIIVVIYAPLMLHRWKLHKERSRLRKELRSLELMRWDYSQSLNTRNGTNMDHLEANLEANKKTSPLPTFRSDSVNEEQDLEKKIANRRVLLEQAQDSVWEEIMLPTYDSFYDYVLATIQFGYVTCFSVVLPFTPVICLINNLLSMRLDAYKLCRGRRRPLVTKAGGIGVWEHVLHIVTVISILTNCSLMALTSNLGNTIKERIGDVGLFFVVVGWEHFMLLIKYIMQAAVPTMPQSVISDKMREKHQRAQQNRFSMRAKKERRSAGVTATHSFASNDEFHRESIKTEHLESGLLEKTKSPANETVYSKSNISTQTVVRSNTTTAQTNTEIGQDKQTQFSPPIESVKDIVRRLNSVGKPPQKKQLSPLRSWKQKRRMSPKRSPRRNNNSNVNPSPPTRIAKSPLQTLRRRMTRSNSLKREIEKRKKAPLPLTPTRASRKSPPVKLTATLSSRTRRRTILDQGISSLSPTSDTYSEYYTPVQQKLDFDSSSPLLKPQRSVHSPITQHNIPAESPFDGKERVNGEDDEIGEIELLNDIASVQTSLFGEKVIERDPKHAIENGSDDDFLLADFDAAPANTIKNESKLRGPLLTKVEFDKENELGIVNTLSNLTEGDTMKFVNSSRRRRRKY